LPFDSDKHAAMANRTQSVATGKARMQFLREMPFAEQPRVIDHRQKNLGALKEI